jgi:hypothetical protein
MLFLSEVQKEIQREFKRAWIKRKGNKRSNHNFKNWIVDINNQLRIVLDFWSIEVYAIII